jgi:hypothetical protein
MDDALSLKLEMSYCCVHHVVADYRKSKEGKVLYPSEENQPKTSNGTCWAEERTK